MLAGAPALMAFAVGRGLDPARASAPEGSAATARSVAEWAPLPEPLPEPVPEPLPEPPAPEPPPLYTEPQPLLSDPLRPAAAPRVVLPPPP
ncbi:MAG TPA: hypothetical protein VLS89_19545, partial [Candidatus Nanopelagicales bacterium]|nr:hypothetical protein [Candidatus Nanopelagicales bacterium]